MAAKKKVTVKKSGKVVDLAKGKIVVADYELRKVFDKFRKDFAGLVGDVARIDADMKRGVETAKVAKNTVSKLMKDPLVSVPQDLAKKVVELEAKLAKVKTQMAERARQDYVQQLHDDTREALKKLTDDLETVSTTVAAHDDRLDDLDDAITAPKEHANPPDHPAPDPRQTTLDDAIARAKNGAGAATVNDNGADDAEETNEHDEDDEARADEAGGAPT